MNAQPPPPPAAANLLHAAPLQVVVNAEDCAFIPAAGLGKQTPLGESVAALPVVGVSASYGAQLAEAGQADVGLVLATAGRRPPETALTRALDDFIRSLG